MNRRKVVKQRVEGPLVAKVFADENGGLPQDGAAGEGEDALKRLWHDLMSDLSRVLLSTHEVYPHRFDEHDEQRVDGKKKSFGLALVALIGGAAVLMALIEYIVG